MDNNSNVIRFPGKPTALEVLDQAKAHASAETDVLIIMYEKKRGVQFVSTDINLGDHCYLLKEHELKVADMFLMAEEPSPPTEAG